MAFAKSLARRVLGRASVVALGARLGVRSYSQEGEDRLLARYFENSPNGFYVDVGAHHPYRFSNTHLLYRSGWSGINIDAMPGSMGPFRRARPRDCNLEIGISEDGQSGQFYVFDEPALNTFDAETARVHQKVRSAKIKRVIEIPTLPLRDVLQRHVGDRRAIDLLTVDAEGRDLAVLRSNDWVRFRPRVVLAESLGATIEGLAEDPCAIFLRSVGYHPFAKTVNTVMYVDGAAK